MTLTLTSDDLESHIIVNVSLTLTNTTIGLWLHCVWLWTYERMDGWTYVQTDGHFTGFIRSSLRRWPKTCC